MTLSQPGSPPTLRSAPFCRALVVAHSESDRLHAMVGPQHASALLADTIEVKLDPS